MPATKFNCNTSDWEMLLSISPTSLQGTKLHQQISSDRFSLLFVQVDGVFAPNDVLTKTFAQFVELTYVRT